MDILLALGTALLLFGQGPLYKIYNKKCVAAGKTDDFLLNVFNFGTGLAVLIPLSLVGSPFDANSFLWGVANGVFFCSMLIFYNKSLKLGKIAFVNFMMAMAMVIPLLGGMALFGEEIYPLQWAGLAVLLAASYLVSYGQRDKDAPEQPTQKKFGVKLWILAVLGMLANGGLSLFIKYSHYANPGLNQTQFLMGSYLTSFAAVSVIAAFTTKGRPLRYIPNKWFVLLGFAVGVVTILGNMAFTFFSVQARASVFYPITGALPMLLGALISPLFKEKLSKMTLAGLILGTAAIILLNF